MNLKLQRIEIRNVKGIEHLVVDAADGAVISVRGKNGTGKSSFLDAVGSIFEKGHDPDLIRHGEDQAEVTLLLNDGTQIVNTIKPTSTKSTLVVKRPDGSRPPPKTFVNELAIGIGFDPSKFLTANAKARAEYLEQVLPITFSLEEVNTAAGLPRAQKPVSLDGMNQIIDGLRADRRDANRDLEQLTASNVELRKAIPKETDVADWRNLARDLGTALSDAKARKAEALADVDAVTATTAQQLHAAAVASVEHLRLEFEDAKAAVLFKESQAKEAAISDGSAKKAEIEQQHGEALEALASQYAQMQQKVAESDRMEGLRRQLDASGKRHQELSAKTTLLDNAVKQLEALKKERLSSSMVPGVEVKSGEVYVDGVTWEHVNKARRVQVAMAIASHCMGDLKLMILDEGENLDSETRAALHSAVAEAGMQLIEATVDDGEFRVSAEKKGQ